MSLKSKIIFLSSCAFLSLLFPLLSGRAEGYASFNALLFLLPIVLAFGTLKNALSLVWGTFRKNKPQQKTALQLFSVYACSLGFCFLCLLAASGNNERKIAKSKETGDKLIEEINRHYRQNGYLPQTLKDEPFSNFRPDLANSSFWIEQMDGGNFTVGFNSILFMNCTKGHHDADWICDD